MADQAKWPSESTILELSLVWGCHCFWHIISTTLFFFCPRCVPIDISDISTLLWSAIVDFLQTWLYIETASVICYHAGCYFLIGCMGSFLNAERLLQAVIDFQSVPQLSSTLILFSALAVFLLQVFGTLLFFRRFEFLKNIAWCAVLVGFSNM